MNERLQTICGCFVSILFIAGFVLLAAFGPALQMAFLFGLVLYLIYYLVTPPNKPKLEKIRWYHKLSLGISIIATITMLVALSPFALKIRIKIPYDFYILLRWIVCVAFVNLLFFRLRLWFRVILLAGAILYNPIAMVHLGSRTSWAVCNIGAISVFAVAWIVIIYGENECGLFKLT